ncbi:MAG: discoidin domain-containing protein, partial [Armatimonadota bacterium]|nr:discoidin domain-containing protein [Armatimonadota bacterium]
MRMICVAVVLAVLLPLGAGAAPFGEDWQKEWTLALEHACDADDVVRRTPEGALEIDTPDGGHVNWFGGEGMHDFAVTARVKFLRADDKYSGFSLFVRWNGQVWSERDCYWIYLRPKFRSLYMQKVVGGKLDKAFPERIEAVRPKATPLNEWMTLRAEVRGRRIEVYLRPQSGLHDELHLSATDDGLFPILSGRMGFGVGNAHLIVADVEQTNLEESHKLEIESYEYVNAPNRGDEARTILTDGEVNPRGEQAFWRMLGESPEIVFDLGEERFITRAVLRAISSPAVNIASAEVQGSSDGEQWRTLAMLSNEDSGRAEAEHAIEGQVRGVARYVKLILNRPAADQDVELAEVELYGREPTEEDRQAAAAAAYDTGPPMPETSDAGREDEHYWYLQSEQARFAIDKRHGLVGGVWCRAHGAKCIERLSDGYYLYTREGDTETDEYADEITQVLDRDDRMLRLRCRNPQLPEIEIEKTYSISPDGRRLIKRVAWTNTGEAEDRFLTHQTGGIAVEEFRRGGVYMGCDRGLGARLFADEVTMPRQISALGARNAKVVLLHRYDLGWGVGHFRHQVNDRWCRPLTSRWHERENHPPIYLPNGWEFGVATLHLAPDREQSTEVQLALYDGRQIDFYRMWRSLPETAAAFDSVARPRWHLDLKTSSNISQYSITEDLGPALMSIERSLALVETGNLWNLTHIHGVWGEWFTEGVVESGQGAKIDTQWLKDFIAECHARSPRVKLGVYTWAWAVHPRSQVYQQHPEWFITTDRSGQVFNAYSNMVLNHARRLGIEASMDELIGQFADVMEDFGGDYFYLDGGGGGQNLIDWEHLGCDQDYHYEELYRRIREVT